MKKLMKNKKGFTIVELVIVIAVIGILAAVLIPTFSGVIDSANKSSRVQQTENALKSLIVNLNGELKSGATYYFCIDKYVYKYDGGKIDFDAETAATLPDVDSNTIVVYSKAGAASDITSGMACDKYVSNSTFVTSVTPVAVSDFSKNVVVVEATEKTTTDNTQNSGN